MNSFLKLLVNDGLFSGDDRVLNLAGAPKYVLVFDSSGIPSLRKLTPQDPSKPATRTVAGTTWRQFDPTDDRHRSVVRTANGATYVVVSTADWPQVEAFTKTLQPG